MLKVRLAEQNDYHYFVSDYLSRYGQDQELAHKYATACIDINRSLMLYLDEEIIGAMTWSIREKVSLGLVEIIQMTIPKPENRGKGYGNLLVQHGLKDMESYFSHKNYELRRVFIGIHGEHLAARNVYKNNGFRVLAEFENHRRDKLSEFIYARDFFN
ncbi:GCN5-related N-acetyltransferase [Alkaliphilus metalliredigens QYMF]|uniref:GCN5-related N-acetyltransferase n=1 Tax=Alkaliphilus metalliredigens (strain QYMF) TaxID=293826 RepID=A6TMM4_ALKMQ|nr:GNAT family N-acetyltransferase [Alkaliphilus metalliredigens]ABR47442.1 GCN5-related N-acetyltransferase [Alkaliphilus metalliredigens QYMF]